VVTPQAPDHHAHPVFCLVHNAMQDSLVDYLSTGRRSMQGWLTQVHALQVAFDDASFFVNLNTPQELAQVQRC
jgi:molybdopterin-guanine dinucleotide biosynthesis protein A